jgi:carbon monoxide dehydrogenase subunit G
MKIAGEYLFDGPRDEVWEVVQDPKVLASALPGAQSMTEVGEGEFEGKMHVRIGPVSGVFSGRVVVSDAVPPERYTLSVKGQGVPGFCNGTGQVELVDRGDGTTLLKYEGDLHFGGRLAGVGQRMIESASKSMTRQGLESLNRSLQARRADVGEREEVAYAPPSEAGFAVTVARDMAADMLASMDRTALMAAAAAIVGMAIGFWLGRRVGDGGAANTG